MRARATSLILGCLLSAAAWLSPAPASTVQYWAVSDSFVFEGAPSTNYADDPFLNIGGALDDSGPGFGTKRAFVQMPALVEPNPFQYTSFFMILRNFDESVPSPIGMYAVDQPFDMQTLTWDNQPPASTLITSFVPVPGKPFAMPTLVLNLPDLSDPAYINAFHNGIMFRLLDESGADHAAFVAEGSYKNPELLIQQHISPEPGTWAFALLAAGGVAAAMRRR
jgi:PEP-CTERM motif.